MMAPGFAVRSLDEAKRNPGDVTLNPSCLLGPHATKPNRRALAVATLAQPPKLLSNSLQPPLPAPPDLPYRSPMRTRNLYKPGAAKPFVLSRSRVENFLKCARCFYIDRRLGVEPPSGPPFNINSAVDHLLKKEFDDYRTRGEPHPYMVDAGIDAIPFAHPKLDEWRENFKGVRTLHAASGFELSGAIDDLWQDRTTGKLIVVDYKATAKDGEVGIDAGWQIGYRRQMEFYQWLLRQNGLDVDDTGYFVYCNGDRSQDRFDGAVRFKVSVISYTGNTKWVERTLLAARACLESDIPPAPTENCEQCAYLADINKLAL